MVAKDLSVSLCGIRLKNPVIPASGTFGFGLELAGSVDLGVLGGISLKGTTREARAGNPTPRIAECNAGMINSVGLQNPGIDVLVHEKAPALRKIYDGCIIANISGFSVGEYAHNCALADACPDIDILEVNISCPNVHNGGMAFGTDPGAAAAVTAAVRAVVKEKPVFIKLSPNVTDIVSVARACEDAGADGLTLINTLLGMRIDIRRRKPVIANKMGGFSGPAVFPVALRMVYQVAHACAIPVMGCGGVARAEDVVEMMMAGATAVQVGAENLRNPQACPEILEALPGLMDSLGINTLQEIIGTAELCQKTSSSPAISQADSRPWNSWTPSKGGASPLSRSGWNSSTPKDPASFGNSAAAGIRSSSTSSSTTSPTRRRKRCACCPGWTCRCATCTPPAPSR